MKKLLPFFIFFLTDLSPHGKHGTAENEETADVRMSCQSGALIFIGRRRGGAAAGEAERGGETICTERTS